jgi:hypothetical protein
VAADGEASSPLQATTAKARSDNAASGTKRRRRMTTFILESSKGKRKGRIG